MPRIISPWKTYHFYRSQLTPESREVYETILEGLTTWQKRIPLKKAYSIEYVYEIFTMVLRDCPLLFHVNLRMTLSAGFVSTILPDYIMTPEEYEGLFRKVVAFARSSRHKMDSMDLYHRAKNIHDAMTKHVIYDETNVHYAHNVLGSILEKKAVCESMAKAFKLLCDVNQIPCIVVFGYAGSTDGKTWASMSAEEQEDNHAWNRIRVGSHWYNVDLTFDIGMADYPNTGTFRYDFFCRSDSVFAADHRPSCPTLPVCDADHSVYHSLGLYARKPVDVMLILRNALKEGRQTVVFEWAPTMDMSPAAIHLSVNLAAAGARVSSWSLRPNEALRIMSISFQ